MTQKERNAKKRGSDMVEQAQKLDAVLDDVDPILTERQLQNLPLVEIATVEVLRGTSPKDIQEIFKQEGFVVSMNKTYNMIKIARKEIIRQGQQDINAKIAWAQANFMEIHRQATGNNDVRTRMVAIVELCKLWGVYNRPEPDAELEITEEHIAAQERMILR